MPDIQYANWLSMVLAGLKGMEMFSPASGEWKQAHSQARFVITQVMLEAGQDFLTIKEVTGEDGKPDLLITMDRSKIMSVGQPAISQFLTKLQVMFLYCQVLVSLFYSSNTGLQEHGRHQGGQGDV